MMKLVFYGMASAILTSAPSAGRGGETISYSYDALGRLVRVAHSGSANASLNGVYAYDRAGNRTQVSTSGVSGGPVVADWSFEDPGLGTGYAYDPTPSGVVFSGSAGIAANGSAWGFSTAPDGSQVAFLQSNGGAGSIDQSVSGLTAGRSYRVTFAAASRPGFASNVISISVGGSALFAAAPASNSTFTHYSTSSFTAAGSTATIHFVAQTTPADTSSAIDAVTIEDAGVAPSSPAVGDPSFEDPNVGNAGFSYAPSASGVNFNSSAGVASNGSAWGFPTAPSGNQVAFLQSSSSNAGVIDQTISGLVAGRVYHLTFMAVQRPGYGTNPVIVSVAGAQLLSMTPASASSFARYTTQSFAASASTMTVRFATSVTSTDSASGIDDVAIIED